MKLVAASKMRGDISRWEAALPFGNIFERLAAQTGDEDAEDTFTPESTMVIANCSDRGLCGGINSQMGKEAKSTIAGYEKAGQGISVALVGDKGKAQLKRPAGHYFSKTFGELTKKPATFASFSALAEHIIDSDVDQFDLIHNHFVSQISYEQVHRKFKNLNAVRKTEDGGVVPDLVPHGLAGYEFEPECKAEALANLGEMQLASNLYYASMDGSAAEQSARRAAMDNASKNAAEMVEKFTMQYNRLRQAKITTELTEIVSGAEALNDGED